MYINSQNVIDGMTNTTNCALFSEFAKIPNYEAVAKSCPIIAIFLDLQKYLSVGLLSLRQKQRELVFHLQKLESGSI